MCAGTPLRRVETGKMGRRRENRFPVTSGVETQNSEGKDFIDSVRRGRKYLDFVNWKLKRNDDQL